MNMASDRKKKIAFIGVASLILVAMVVALVYGTQDREDAPTKDVATSQKAISTICESVDYKEACEETLKSGGNDTTDPKKLIEMGLEAAKKYIQQAAENSTLFQNLETDPKAKLALENCRELAGRAVNDLDRSFSKFSNFDVINWDLMLEDLKIWLSGAITYQETCLDGFEGISTDAGAKMRTALTKAMQLTSNGLAMVTEISTYLESIGTFVSNKRRLLSEEMLPVLGHGDDFPDWLDIHGRRKLLQQQALIKPNLVVAKDGSGNFKTINEALAHIPENSETAFILYIKEGVYEEQVRINSTIKNLLMIGDGPKKTRITGRLNYIDGTPTYHTATVSIQGDHFMAKNIGFENAAGAAKHQAVALRVSADKVVFYNCQMDGFQDTLYAHTYRQFYRDCTISGTIDFIFGDSAAIFQSCTFVVRKPLDNQQNIVTAQGRKDVRQPTGIVIQNGSFVAEPEYYPVRNKIKSYLGRPWKEFSRTIIMESFIDDLIQPQGYLPWNETFALKTLFYTEFNNRGPGSSKQERVKWPGIKELPAKRIQRFTVADFYEGESWIKATGTPFSPGFIFPVPADDGKVQYSAVVPQENKDLGSSKDKSAYIAKETPAEKTKENKKDTGNPKTTDEVISPEAPISAPVDIPVVIAPITSIPDNSITIAPQDPIANPPQSDLPDNLATADSPSGSLAPESSPSGILTPTNSLPGIPDPQSDPSEILAPTNNPSVSSPLGTDPSGILTPESSPVESSTLQSSPSSILTPTSSPPSNPTVESNPSGILAPTSSPASSSVESSPPSSPVSPSVESSPPSILTPTSSPVSPSVERSPPSILTPTSSPVSPTVESSPPSILTPTSSPPASPTVESSPPASPTVESSPPSILTPTSSAPENNPSSILTPTNSPPDSSAQENSTSSSLTPTSSPPDSSAQENSTSSSLTPTNSPPASLALENTPPAPSPSTPGTSPSDILAQANSLLGSSTQGSTSDILAQANSLVGSSTQGTSSSDLMNKANSLLGSSAQGTNPSDLLNQANSLLGSSTQGSSPSDMLAQASSLLGSSTQEKSSSDLLAQASSLLGR